jgi:hypothetical protein
MDSEQLQTLIRWLTEQINYTNNVINDAHVQNNFGREAQYEGMRDAFQRCLNKVVY